MSHNPAGEGRGRGLDRSEDIDMLGVIDPNAHRIAKALLTWDVAQHGRPSTWDLGRGTGRGAIAVARVLEAYRASGLAEITGRDRNGARQWRLTAEGEKFARQALAAVEEKP